MLKCRLVNVKLRLRSLKSCKSLLVKATGWVTQGLYLCISTDLDAVVTPVRGEWSVSENGYHSRSAVRPEDFPHVILPFPVFGWTEKRTTSNCWFSISLTGELPRSVPALLRGRTVFSTAAAHYKPHKPSAVSRTECACLFSQGEC